MTIKTRFATMNTEKKPMPYFPVGLKPEETKSPEIPPASERTPKLLPKIKQVIG